jgi:glycosyltransferase involved in cell wall biosynthesis
MSEKFSILTATYNCAKYLNDWANSILNQDYDNIEVVLVDDHSKDKTNDIVKGFYKKFKDKNIEFKYLKSPKKLFCGSAYNLALKNANGTYFGILDSDDMLESFACKTIVEIYDKNPKIAWIYTQYNKYNRRMDRIIRKGFCRYPGKGKTILEKEKKHVNTYGHWRTFSNRINSFDNLFGDGLKCCVDKNLGIRLEECGIGMFVNKICYKYRTRTKGENSIVHKYKLRDIRQEVVQNAKRRRHKNKKIFPILKYKN